MVGAGDVGRGWGRIPNLLGFVDFEVKYLSGRGEAHIRQELEEPETNAQLGVGF